MERIEVTIRSRMAKFLNGSIICNGEPLPIVSMGPNDLRKFLKKDQSEINYFEYQVDWPSVYLRSSLDSQEV